MSFNNLSTVIKHVPVPHIITCVTVVICGRMLVTVKPSGSVRPLHCSTNVLEDPYYSNGVFKRSVMMVNYLLLKYLHTHT